MGGAGRFWCALYSFSRLRAERLKQQQESRLGSQAKCQSQNVIDTEVAAESTLRSDWTPGAEKGKAWPLSYICFGSNANPFRGSIGIWRGYPAPFPTLSNLDPSSVARFASLALNPSGRTPPSPTHSLLDGHATLRTALPRCATATCQAYGATCSCRENLCADPLAGCPSVHNCTKRYRHQH
ncbi:hypothetical protein B0J13DRAFT_169640 [Dactylonectria estremocensis]|uniref:Uncharacterized protein n=1 Tax=Dactylonectria estremocensis TaxID=1079267 RepID=A0A9P9FB24_9HYPO|nr:hypothetical protein B0J13DRAFT_169640 [Dactylonectria estremocensis]